jgi:hypothetical protein
MQDGYQIGAIIHGEMGLGIQNGIDVLVISPVVFAFDWIANTGILSCLTREAATSSWVLSGLEAHNATLAPPDLSVCIRDAVSVVTCRHAPRRTPFNGFSFSNRFRIRFKTGMF